MRTMLILIFLFTFLNLNAQNPAKWYPKLLTYIPYIGGPSSNERVAIFANHNGIHVIKSIPSGPLGHVKYFRLTSEGAKPNGFPVEGISLDSYGDLPNILGNESIIYTVYRKDYTIQVKYSIDGGDNWSTINQINFFNINATNCNGVDAAYTLGKGLHVVWSEKVGTNYETYFKRYFNSVWGTTQPLTNASPINNGGFPTVTTSYYNGQEKAHVTINTGNGDNLVSNFGQNYSVDYNYFSWSSPIAILPQGQQSHLDKLIFTEDGYLHSFYYKHTAGLPNYMYRRKLVTSSSWGAEKQIEVGLGDGNGNQHKIQIAKTIGNIGSDTVHAFWMDDSPGFWQRKKNSSDEEWTLPEYNVSLGGVGFRDAAVTSASNDLYALWSQFHEPPVWYEFRHYDDKLSAPTNLTINESINNHPYLDWDTNNEPDVNKYYVYRKDYYGGGWQYLSQTTNTYYEDQTLTYCHAIPPAQCQNVRRFDFYVTAIDLNLYESDPSNTVSANLVGGPPNKIGGKDPSLISTLEYSLDQNYPNPFNPTTTINYTIKSAGLVTLKVYDMLGTEVASLVNENKEAGNYSVTFDAATLPSGMYVYKLSADNFVATKKLILLK